jgi:outer membrane protein
MSIKNRKLALGLAIAACTIANTSMALDKGDWIVRVGVHNVMPDSDHSLTGLGGNNYISVDSAASLSINVGYMLTKNVALDILGALPFKHDIQGEGALEGLGKIGETKHLPPTVSLQYHFSPKASVRPFVGAGINYTTFFEDKHTGALEGSPLTLDDSWGLAVQAGVDFDINKKWFASADVRYINIETTATSGTAGTFDVKINPWVVGISVGTTF